MPRLINVLLVILILSQFTLIGIVWYPGPPPSGAFIRAMPVFRQPEHAKDVVRCCRNHTAEHSGKDERKLHPLQPNHEGGGVAE